MRVLITDFDYEDVEIERRILEGAGLEVVAAQCRTEEDVVEAGRGASALLTQYAPITARVMDELPELHMVGRYGVGYDVVDVDAARERGVWVANVPDYGTEEVASHALSMALALLRHLPLYDRGVREGRWHPHSTGPLHRLKNLTLGVVGVGRIGGTFARRAAPWFGRTLGCDPYLDAWPEGVEPASLEEVFSESLLVSLHAPLTEETRGLVDRRLLERMPEGSYLVNTARGGMVVIDDLLWALEEGPLAGAALDVLPHEPPPADHPLLSNQHVILTPHAAYYSLEAEEEARTKAARNVVAWAKEGRPLYPVVEGRGSS
ncbi:MAG TPA: C-terminal binding protein [Rubrobacteraceae bacterium]|nr:C-terminal binding protein [Rubrobacteraceae bacterium]